jgi:hypothetical protein
MTPGIWIGSTVSERIANLHREAEHERLIRSVRHRRQARHGGWVGWHGWVGRIRGEILQLRRRPSWPGPQFLTQRGDRS